MLAVVAAGCVSDGVDGSAEGAEESGNETGSAEVSSSTDPTGENNAADTPAATRSDQDGTDTVETVEPVVWESCDGGLECGQVVVPIDHDQPDGPTLEIGLVRVPAVGAAQGSIFVNPGGPGGSGVSFVTNGFRLDAESAGRYHLVGFDPRGTGSSGQPACRLDRSVGPLPDFSPDSDAERQDLDSQAAGFAQSCGDLDASLLPHVDTGSVIRDLDLLRQAVGDSELHYIGFSYGTLIGILYADLFPERVGHLVLDGVVDPTFSLPDLLTQQTEAFNEAFLIMDAACGDRLDCPPGGIAVNHDLVVDRLERSGPVGEVGSTEADAAALVALYNEDLWPRYVRSLDRALGGDYGGLEDLSDFFLTGVSFASYAAVSCTDSPRPTGTAAWDRFATDLASNHARFGATIANELRVCAFWPVDGGPSRQAVSASGAPPILVIGTSNDPATPLANAVSVSEALDDGRLIVFEGDRHTAYSASACVRQLVSDYFVADIAPTTTVTC